MDRSLLVAEAKLAGKNAAFNLKKIQKNPGVMIAGEIEDAEIYLNNMIRIAKMEMKNDRRLGQSQLSTRLKYLVASILTLDRVKRKGAKGYGL